MVRGRGQQGWSRVNTGQGAPREGVGTQGWDMLCGGLGLE